MRIIIGCEYSGVVREAFRKRGHDAWSCDILDTDIPGQHIKGDLLEHLNDGWDMMICHPPCTDIAVSGARHFEEKRADGRQQKALDFVGALLNAPIDKICLENPVSIISSHFRKPEQIIQPWMFGHDASKTTCLWLKNLPKLKHTKIIPPKGYKLVKYASDCRLCDLCGEPYCDDCEKHYTDCDCPGPDDGYIKTICGYPFKGAGKAIWSNQTPSGQNKLGPSEDRWKLRSKTYQGIADAMAEQWDVHLN